VRLHPTILCMQTHFPLWLGCRRNERCTNLCKETCLAVESGF